MQNITGHALSSVRPILTDMGKRGIGEKLSRDFNTLRQLPVPGYFGNVDGGKLGDDLFWTATETQSLKAPFATSNGITTHFASAEKAAYYRRILPRVLEGDKPVFTHADFQKKNIIVQS